jgi:hypothetical protein
LDVEGSMKLPDIKKLLLYEIENKKGYVATWKGYCDGCRGPIGEGEEFIFMGDKRKICTECQEDVIQFLEE